MDVKPDLKHLGDRQKMILNHLLSGWRISFVYDYRDQKANLFKLRMKKKVIHSLLNPTNYLHCKRELISLPPKITDVLIFSVADMIYQITT